MISPLFVVCLYLPIKTEKTLHITASLKFTSQPAEFTAQYIQPHSCISLCNWLCLSLLSLSLVSTYVVCERLSVMHEPAGVVEILVQILQFTPIL